CGSSWVTPWALGASSRWRCREQGLPLNVEADPRGPDQLSEVLLMRRDKGKRFLLETLEDRLTPSSYTIMGSGTTLTITQTAGVSAGTTSLDITDDPATGTITLSDTGGTDTVTLTTSGFSNLTVNL